MKRKLIWLILPLLLLAIMLAVKWRLDHPTPTPEALKVRAILTQSSQVDVYLAEALPWETHGVNVRLSAQEKKAFTESFWLLPQPMDVNATLFPYGSTVPTIGIDYTIPQKTISSYPPGNSLTVQPLSYVNVNLSLAMDGSKGQIFIDASDLDGDRNYQLHPATVRRWIHILLTNPQLGPALRARGVS